jgi:hypothetical protein
VLNKKWDLLGCSSWKRSKTLLFSFQDHCNLFYLINFIFRTILLCVIFTRICVSVSYVIAFKPFILCEKQATVYTLHIQGVAIKAIVLKSAGAKVRLSSVSCGDNCLQEYGECFSIKLSLSDRVLCLVLCVTGPLCTWQRCENSNKPSSTDEVDLDFCRSTSSLLFRNSV